MKSIGLLVACEIEAVLTQYRSELQRVRQNGFDVYILERKNCKLHFVHSGVGLIKAAAAVQMLRDCFKIEFLLNFGVVGALRSIPGREVRVGGLDALVCDTQLAQRFHDRVHRLRVIVLARFGRLSLGDHGNVDARLIGHDLHLALSRNRDALICV